MFGWLFRAAGAAGGWIGADFLLQWGGWAVSSLLKTEKLYDLFGTSTFALVAAGSFLRSARPAAAAAAASAGASAAAAAASSALYARQAAATAMVCLWALRLGSFLVHRVHKTGRDSRFDEAKHDPLKFLIFWTMQGVWVAAVAAPVLLLNVAAAGPAAATATASATRLVWTDVAGPLIWLAGFATEAVADAQKMAFKTDPANAGRFVDTGLWSLARYPNYGGEIAAWCGVGLVCGGSGALTGWKLLACALSPAFVALLLLGVSGVPLQERQQEARWGGREDFVAYKGRTNLLLPVPFALPSFLGGPQAAGQQAEGRQQQQPLVEGKGGGGAGADDGDSDKTR
jgi:steroid 5-alpha reductase family enzyme